MKSQTIFSSIALSGGLMLSAGNVLANSMDTTESFLLDDESGYTSNEMFRGEFYSHEMFEITQAGVYELTLAENSVSLDALAAGDVPGVVHLSHLQARVSTQNEKIAGVDGNSSALFEMLPGTYYLTLFAKTDMADAAGEFGLTLKQSDNGAAVVPVPPALWLLGAGLMGLVGVARRKS